MHANSLHFALTMYCYFYLVKAVLKLMIIDCKRTQNPKTQFRWNYTEI